MSRWPLLSQTVCTILRKIFINSCMQNVLVNQGQLSVAVVEVVFKFVVGTTLQYVYFIMNILHYNSENCIDCALNEVCSTFLTQSIYDNQLVITYDVFFVGDLANCGQP